MAQFKANIEINIFAFKLPLQWNFLSLPRVHYCQESFGTMDRKKENTDFFPALQKFDCVNLVLLIITLKIKVQGYGIHLK